MKKISLLFAIALATLATLARPIRGASAASSEEFPDNNLPYDAEVEYLESSGSQYILMPFLLSETMVYEIKAAFHTGDGYSGFVVGARDRTAGVQRYFAVSGGNLQHRARVGRTIPFDNDFHIYFATPTAVGIDGGYNSMSAVEKASNLVFPLFAYNYGGVIYPNSIRIAYAKFGENLDLIAVRFTNERGEAEGAMYDRVSSELFRNSGTGSFIIGPDKE